jgi:hypothetical protein
MIDRDRFFLRPSHLEPTPGTGIKQSPRRPRPTPISTPTPTKVKVQNKVQNKDFIDKPLASLDRSHRLLVPSSNTAIGPAKNNYFVLTFHNVENVKSTNRHVVISSSRRSVRIIDIRSLISDDATRATRTTRTLP